MSQFDFGTIDPNTKSGTQLALDLNNFRSALNSLHKGSTRPSYAEAGMMWVREVSSTQWDLCIFDGDTDFVLRSLNPTTNTLLTIPSSQITGLDTAIAMGVSKDSTGNTGAAVIPAGNDSQRPAAPANGMLRYNSGLNLFEGYQGGTWKVLTPPTAWGSITGTLSSQTDLQAALADIQSKQQITKEFVSGELTITASGLISIPHSFGARPKFITAEVVCKTASVGWSVGDVVGIAVSPFITDTNITRGIQVAYDPVNVIAKIAANTLAIMNKTSGAVTGVNPADWRLVLRAYV